MRWAEVNEVYSDDLKPLLELVRFKAMTINYLHDIVTSEHPIASTVSNFSELFEEAVFYHAFSKVRIKLSVIDNKVVKIMILGDKFFKFYSIYILTNNIISNNKDPVIEASKRAA